MDDDKLRGQVKMTTFNTPILLLVFNRPDNTLKILNKLREIKPSQLFVAADGPRLNRPGDISSCQETRELVDKMIDWSCKVTKLYRTENLGCGIAVSSAITWFFNHVEQGIILEDDTLPNSSFFSYCEQMLQKYKDDERIMHISGSNYANVTSKESYYFTRIPFIWGWATWRRAWDQYDFNYKYLQPDTKNNIINKAFNNKEIVDYWLDKLKDFHLNPLSFTWDYQWFLSIWDKNGLVIQPKKNLVENIGFDENATHTVSSDHHLANFGTEELEIINHQPHIIVDSKLQDENFCFYFKPTEKDTRTFKEKIQAKFRFKFAQMLYNLLSVYKPEIKFLNNAGTLETYLRNSTIGPYTLLYPVYQVYNSQIGDYTYIARNSVINNTTIGKFCSIGPNLICGWGIHPTHTLSTAPMFYSTRRQNGISLTSSNKIEEMKSITIGNDVFIGMNVTILDGVNIGDGAVIGAGAVVSKNIPPYAIAVGNPIRIMKYRFEEDKIKALLNIKWWEWEEKQLPEVEKYFEKVDEFISKYN